MTSKKHFFSSCLTFLATLGPIGLSPKAPGTMGSLIAMLAAPFCFLPLSFSLKLTILAAIFLGGSFCATQVEKDLGQKDPGSVVIDELLGQWLVFLPCTELHWYELLAGFIFFRFFDILKPTPVKNAENWLPDGWGVMIDDGIAGLYGQVCLLALLFLTNRTDILSF